MIEQLIVVVLVASALLISIINGRHRVQDAKKRLIFLKQKERQQAQRLRKIAYRSLNLKRKLIHSHGRGQDTKAEMEQMENEMKRISDPQNRIYVFEERRSASERTFLAQVTSKSGTDSAAAFAGTRKFVLWAADEANARARLARRWPAEQGFTLGAISPFQWPGPVPEDPKAAKAAAAG
jgi:hypothetical protein